LLGNELVNWLVENELAFSKSQAIAVGRWLEHWKVLEHCVNENRFEDDALIYCFIMPLPPTVDSPDAHSAVRFEFRVVIKQLDADMDLRCVVALKVRGEKLQQETPQATGVDGSVKWDESAVLTSTLALSVGEEEGESERKVESKSPVGEEQGEVNVQTAEVDEQNVECARAPFARKRATLVVKTLDRREKRRFFGEAEINLAKFANQGHEEAQCVILPLKRCAVGTAQLHFEVHCRPLDACILTPKDQQRAILLEVAADMMGDLDDDQKQGQEQE
jgi:hypothetical protein